jgi:hypothetical protein
LGGLGIREEKAMFGTIFVSVIGISLPIGAGVWFAPRGEGDIFAVVSQSVAELKRSGSLLLEQSRQLLGSLGASARLAR